VHVGMSAVMLRMCRREAVTEPVHGAGEIQHTKQDQHKGHGEFQRESEPRWDDDAEKNDSGSDHENS